MKFISISKLKYAFTYLKALLYTKIEANNLFATKESVYTKTAANDSFAPKSITTTVGDSNGGLVKDVNDLKTDVGGFPNGLKNRVLGLEFTVGDNLTGLVKDVNGLKTTVGDSNSGLVKDVSSLKTTVGDSSNGVVNDVNTLKTTVGDNNSGVVKDVNTLKTTVGSSTSGLVKDVTTLNTLTNSFSTSLPVSISTGEEYLYVGTSYPSDDPLQDRLFGQTYVGDFALPIVIGIEATDTYEANYPLLHKVVELLKPFMAFQVPIKVHDSDHSGTWGTYTEWDSENLVYYIKAGEYTSPAELFAALDGVILEISSIDGISSCAYEMTDELGEIFQYYDNTTFEGGVYDSFRAYIPKYSLNNKPDFIIINE